MDFRLATEEDILFVNEHSLYEPMGKDESDCVDFVYALEHEEKTLAIGGFRMITNTTAWAWMQFSEFIGNHIIPTYRIIGEYTEVFCKNHNITRLQSWVDVSFTEGIRMVKHQGFEMEYIMKDFLAKGQDAFLFVKYFDGD